MKFMTRKGVSRLENQAYRERLAVFQWLKSENDDNANVDISEVGRVLHPSRRTFFEDKLCSGMSHFDGLAFETFGSESLVGCLCDLLCASPSGD